GAGDPLAAGQVGYEDLEEVRDRDGVAAKEHIHREHDDDHESHEEGRSQHARWQKMPMFPGFIAVKCHLGAGIQGCHRPAPFPRRRSQTKTGAPISAVMMPAGTSPGSRTTRPMTSAVIRRAGAETMVNGRIQR